MKIALGDLRHGTVGLHSIYIPLGIGYIGSYFKKKYTQLESEVRLYTNPEEMILDLEEWRPDVVGVSNYIWSSNLGYRIGEISKNQNPEVLTISGGPNFPLDDRERKEWFQNRPNLDFYTLSDGEEAFFNAIEAWLGEGSDIEKTKLLRIDGVCQYLIGSDQLIVGEPVKRFNNLDDVPSSYLDGTFDKFLNGKYMPALNTSRGCPYTCTFCHTGNPHKVRSHTVERVKDELNYIATNLQDREQVGLSIFDDNFGLFKEDDEIAMHIASLKRSTGWPDRVEGAGMVKKGGNSFMPHTAIKSRNLGWSFQSLNPKTLKEIRRKNPSRENILTLAKEIRKRQDTIPCELIAPMPYETFTSYLDGQRFLIDHGFSTQTYTTMMLPGTEMNKPEARKKHGLKTKYRLIPRQFGEYKGKKVFEVEEVCIATNDMPYHEYLDIRDVSLIIRIFTTEQFSLLDRFLLEHNLSRFEFVEGVFHKIKNGSTPLDSIFSNFRKEAQEELFDSKKELIEEYSREDEYRVLLSNERADNLIRKYTAKVYWTIEWEKLLNLVYGVITNMVKSDIKVKEALDSICSVLLFTRNLRTNLLDDSLGQDHIFQTKYDVLSWTGEKFSSPLSIYQKPSDYRTFSNKNTDRAVESFQNYRTQRRGDDEFALGNLIARGFRLSDIWLSYEMAANKDGMHM